MIHRWSQIQTTIKWKPLNKAANNHYKSIVEYKNGGIEENEWDSVSIPDQPLFLPTDLESDMETDITDDDQRQGFKSHGSIV